MGSSKPYACAACKGRGKKRETGHFLETPCKACGAIGYTRAQLHECKLCNRNPSLWMNLLGQKKQCMLCHSIGWVEGSMEVCMVCQVCNFRNLPVACILSQSCTMPAQCGSDVVWRTLRARAVWGFRIKRSSQGRPLPVVLSGQSSAARPVRQWVLPGACGWGI